MRSPLRAERRRQTEDVELHELARVPLFERLSGGEIEKLESLATRKKFAAATAVFFQDDPSDSLYVVLSGSAKVFRTSEDGRDRIMTILRPGDAFGELAMIEGQPRSATVQTLEDTEMLVLTRRDFERFASEHPDFLFKLLQSMCERVRRINEDVLDLSFKDVPYRVLRLLSQLVARHGESGPDGWRIRMPLSVRELSSMVGSNTETVGRLLDRYESDGLVRRQGPNWLVPDQGALNRALEYASAE
jgi:CRP/FNR family transcriptional regulator, cyclic AMP receptor protein